MEFVKRFFFDSYALIEIYYGNKNYEKYLGSGVVTTRLNLMECYYHLLQEHGEQIANRYYDGTIHYAIEFSDIDIKNAMRFRLEAKKRKKNLSYVDALGYVIAKRLEIRFLTGDMTFEDLPNVEYAK